MNRLGRALLLTGVSMLLLSGVARAIPPQHVSDAELASHPVIVVARWDEAPLEGPPSGAPEIYHARTKLVIERVIRGAVEPGVHEVLLAYRIGWDERGGPVISNTSTMMIGDVSEVKAPNLWFLRVEGDHLAAITYRAAQPVSLEAYFDALGGGNAWNAVPTLLSTSEDPETLRRTMRYVLGRRSTWPHYGRGFEDEAPRVETPETADAVAALIDGPVAEVRWNATSTYAALRDDAAHPRLRELLTDADPRVRAVAVGVLARARDAALIPKLAEAVAPIREGYWAMEILEELEGWADPRLVPGVAAFLGNDQLVYWSGAGCDTDIGIPAFAARDILHTLTGHCFPPDPIAAAKAWEMVRELTPDERLPRLRRMAPWPDQPLRAELLRRGDDYVVKVTNTSDRAVTITKLPDQRHLRSTSSCSGGGVATAESADDFLTLEPGGSTEFEFEVPSFFRGGKDRSGMIVYRQIGAKWGKTAWIGKVPLIFP